MKTEDFVPGFMPTGPRSAPASTLAPTALSGPPGVHPQARRQGARLGCRRFLTVSSSRLSSRCSPRSSTPTSPTRAMAFVPAAPPTRRSAGSRGHRERSRLGGRPRPGSLLRPGEPRRPHGPLARRIDDKKVLKLLRAYLKAGVMEDGVKSARKKALPRARPSRRFLPTSCWMTSTRNLPGEATASSAMRTTS